MSFRLLRAHLSPVAAQPRDEAGASVTRRREPQPGRVDRPARSHPEGGFRPPHHILLVEDNPADVRLLKEALKLRGSPHRLSVVGDGAEALRFLREEVPFQGAGRPDLILLDLNLPRLDGRSVLREVKSDPILKSIPVAVLTTSSAPEDVEEAYALQANCYLVKPLDLQGLLQMVELVECFWFQVALLPRKNGEVAS